MRLQEQLYENQIKVDMNKTQQTIICPKCSNDRKKSYERCLSVKIDNNVAVWNCHHCEWHGSVYEKQNVNTIKAPVVPIKKQNDSLSDQAIEWLNKRKITQKTINDFKLYTHNGSLCFPYIYNDEIVNIKYRTPNKQFRQEKNALKTLYNIDRVYDYWEQTQKRQIIFVEGEMDVLAMYECGFKNVVSLPDGAPKEAKFNMEDKRFSVFEQSEWIFDAEEVIIATDSDVAGKALSLELIHRFGRDICKLVHLPKYQDSALEPIKQIKDANECLIQFGKDKLIECINTAEEFPIKDLHTAKEYRNEVQNMYDGNVQRAYSTGYSKLDEIYKVMPSTFNLITGIPNHGKSNFLDQILMNLAEQQDFRFLLYSPEHSTKNHIRRLLEKYCKKPFDIGPYERITQDELNSGIDFIDRHFKFIENTDEIPTIDYIIKKAKVAKLRYGIHCLVIDPFNQVSATRDNNKREDEHIRDIIAKCQQFARNHQIVVYMVAHPHKLHRNDAGIIPPPDLYQVSGSAHWANMCDVGMVIHRDFEENKTTVITRKIREQGVYGEIGKCEFIFNYKTRCYE